MIKRLFDFFFALFGLLFSSLILLPVMLYVWKQDGKLPIYIAPRVGKNEKTFKMVKLRSMSVDADKTGVNSTGINDMRITPIGHFIRKYKLDELTQLWNVLLGDMSLVGPRPNVKSETKLYTDMEKKLLSVKPGITDFSSIIFSDEGEILKLQADPDLAYNQLIRPWKSRLGLIYIDNQSTWTDLSLIFFTMVAIFSKKLAINWVIRKLGIIGADLIIVNVAKRTNELYPYPPPGSNKIVSSR